MRKIKFIVLLIALLGFSVYAMFAQDGQTKPGNVDKPEVKKPEKIKESVKFDYDFTKKSVVKYLFSANTESNVKIRNLTDKAKDKSFVAVLNSDTLLQFTTKEQTPAGCNIEVAIKQLGANYQTDKNTIEFFIDKNGMKTQIDGELDKEIKELDLWEGNWRKEAPSTLNEPIAQFFINSQGEISKAYSLTGTGSAGAKGTKKSLIYLQNPLTLVNLIFWTMPAETQNFESFGNLPLAPKPAWTSTINFPFESPFEFEPIETSCELSLIDEYDAKVMENEVERIEKRKMYKFYRRIENKNFKDFEINAFLEYDLNSKLPRLVTYDIRRSYTQKSSENREIVISQHTIYRFLLQD